jgi:transcriptional regulator with XRE-family HTH domain
MSVDMTERHIGAIVRRLRRQRQLTQEQLAARTGLSQGHVSHLENGERLNPGMTTLKRLAPRSRRAGGGTAEVNQKREDD